MRTITLTSALIALTIIGNVVTKIPLFMGLEIRFGFVFFSAIAYLFGPVVAFAAGLIENTLSYIMGSGGFAGFDIRYGLNTGFAGIIYSIFLYRRNYKSEYFIIWIVSAKIAVNLICNIFINTYLFRGYFGSLAEVITVSRVFKNIVLMPGEIIVMLIAIKYIAGSAYKYKFIKPPKGLMKNKP